jgi:hypothetical protein
MVYVSIFDGDGSITLDSNVVHLTGDEIINGNNYR